MSEQKSLAENASSNPPNPSSAPGDSKPAADTSKASPAADSVKASPPQRDYKKLIPVAIFALAAILFFTISSFWSVWQDTVSVNTDDAFVRADVAPLSTRANGIVVKTLVKDYEKVKAGQTLIELRSEDFKDRVSEAEQTVSQVKIKLEDMKNRKAKLDAQIDDAKAQLENSRATALQFDTTAAIAKTSIEEAKANLAASQSAINQAEASLKSANADAVKAGASRTREERLLAEESSTKERVEQAVDDHDKSLAAIEAQNSARLRAIAESVGRKAQVLKANQQLASIQIDKQKAFTSVKSREADVVSRTMERKLLDGEEQQLKAELLSKQSAADSSRVDLGYTTIKAPVEGAVGELKVKPGQFVNAGTQVITLISSTPWVIANYRETQTAKIKVGDKANIALDALPGKHWSAHVESIAPASGAQFSLLPPDNASGNFTKVTQRIPVKILFDEPAEKLADLRPGMSVTASISPGSH